MESFSCSERNTWRHFTVDFCNILGLLPFMGQMQIHFFIFTLSSNTKSPQRCRTTQANDLKIFLKNHQGIFIYRQRRFPVVLLLSSSFPQQLQHLQQKFVSFFARFHVEEQIPSQKQSATTQQCWGENFFEKLYLYFQSSINEDIIHLIHCRSTLPFFSVHSSATEITRHEVNRYLGYLNSTKDKGHASAVIYLHRNPTKSWKPRPWRQEFLEAVQIRGWCIQTTDSFFQSVFNQLRARSWVKTNKQKTPKPSSNVIYSGKCPRSCRELLSPVLAERLLFSQELHSKGNQQPGLPVTAASWQLQTSPAK